MHSTYVHITHLTIRLYIKVVQQLWILSNMYERMGEFTLNILWGCLHLGLWSDEMKIICR